jgi:hypothetical protein
MKQFNFFEILGGTHRISYQSEGVKITCSGHVWKDSMDNVTSCDSMVVQVRKLKQQHRDQHANSRTPKFLVILHNTQ